MPATNAAEAVSFVHLHVHSHYSVLDSAATVRGIVDAAVLHGMPAVALTDHNSLAGAPAFFDYAIRRGVKPIIGLEANLTTYLKCRNQPLYHILLLARDQKGFSNLMKLSTLSYTKGFSDGPRIDFELLERFSEGLIALSGCLGGEVPRLLRDGHEQAAEAAVKRYQMIFGRENFYIELQNHGLEEQKLILPDLVKVARTCDCPIVASNDVHYIMPEECEAQDAMLCIATRKRIDDSRRFSFASDEFYFKSAAEMKEIFIRYPEAITNSLRIAQRCSLSLPPGKILLPEFTDKKGKTSSVYLESLCEKSLNKRYRNKTRRKDAAIRLKYELSIIKRQGFCDFFLLMHDLIKAARAMNVPVGPGRGGAPGSLVNFLLGITDIDPIKYDLLFEPFINPDMIGLPDIYIDLCGEKRQQAIDYAIQKYGRAQTARIARFARFDARSAIMAAGKVSGVREAQTRRIAELAMKSPHFPNMKAALKNTAELKNISTKGSSAEKRLLRIALALDGLIMKQKTDPCALVISPTDLTELVPLTVDEDGRLLIQYDLSNTAGSGLLTTNFIGLDALTIIQRTCEHIKRSHVTAINLDKIPLTDRTTYELLQSGFTAGIFQLQSEAARDLIKRLKPATFEDIAIFNAIFHRNPLAYGHADEVIERKNGRMEITYPHPLLEPLLKETCGLFIYQEQIMQAAAIIAGYSMSQANSMRRLLGKAYINDLKKERTQFIKGAGKKGINRESAGHVFDLMKDQYTCTFKRAHALAWALLTFRSAWLKAHFPKEFMEAAMSVCDDSYC